jgi:hypothetical protein
MTTIEQMARAMFDVTWRGTCYTWEQESPVGRKHYLEQARAGVEFLKTSSVLGHPAVAALAGSAQQSWVKALDLILNEKSDA